ncbi:methyltransferase-domain-containing protein [Armillaria novae-zelandiae]|uniref:Ribosomal RNA-processing protein 8 n=1 Tax=Armillaria novae-zelandiae TaxID=153914 RepID=A0AA39UK31_9AGAR|nr:methyltransferase-domain-containing protein [Armillaria novae-zelandiae]
MPLFDVPGWSVNSDPVPEANLSSRKRKRTSEDSEKTLAAEANLGKLMSRFKGNLSSQRVKGPKSVDKSSKASSIRKSKIDAHEEKKKAISLPRPLKPVDSRQSSDRPTKRVKTKHRVESSASADVVEEKKSNGLTSLQKEMKESLNGARFRMINETLYKSNSSEAFSMMQEDKNVFEEYHTGFRHQVQSWPTNPVETYITVLSDCPPKTVIADLGCGDAAIARALLPKGFTVLSFDLVSTNAFVVEADICDKLPLPGSEPLHDKGDGEGHTVDVVVCALSLMGVNWPNCIREAWRVLRPDGELKVAEVASRFGDDKQFISLITSIGFRLSSKDASNTHFTSFEFKKVPRKPKTDKEWTSILSKGNILKPCEYKRR